MRTKVYALKNAHPFELEIKEEGNFYGGQYKLRLHSHRLETLEGFAEAHQLQYSLPNKNGLLHSGDLYDRYGLDFNSDKEALDAVLALLESDEYTFDAKGFLALARFAQTRLGDSQDTLRLNKIVKKRFDSSLQNNQLLINTHQSLKEIVIKNRPSVEIAEFKPFKADETTIETLAELMQQNQQLYTNIRKLYNQGVTISNYAATDIQITESWITQLINKFKKLLESSKEPDNEVLEGQEKISARQSNTGVILDKMGTSELDCHLLEDSEMINEIGRKASVLVDACHKNINSKHDSMDWFSWFISKFNELFVSVQKEATDQANSDITSMIQTGALAREEQYIAFEVKQGTYLDGKYDLSSREQRAKNPLITVLDAQNMSNTLKLNVLRCLIEEHGCDVNEVQSYFDQTVLEYLLSSPNSSLYLEKQGGEEVYDIAKLLIEKGASLKPKNKEGALSPLHYAAQSTLAKAPEIMALMIEKGADVNYQAKKGKATVHYNGGYDNELTLSEPTPLAVAAITTNRRKAEMIEVLIKNGADKTVTTEVKIAQKRTETQDLTTLYQTALRRQKDDHYSFHSSYYPSSSESSKITAMLSSGNTIENTL
ncbi:ankyrin repeat domain-containing protein [Legionella resiliens]|uniref:Ankyrin repeats (3 copies) n=1 Tax=Legionella resiliens TaxID=2905958 RepID=A0ABS8X3F8_9GAMM|nr:MULTISPECIES: hypothetical protein [unclassified Legionella]MCE0724160.1 hypothetical protein [Legionella sp. 9fVS26]MCE3533313.1 hypothetical protein [Legionella sp. 8cVS16]